MKLSDAYRQCNAIIKRVEIIHRDILLRSRLSIVKNESGLDGLGQDWGRTGAGLGQDWVGLAITGWDGMYLEVTKFT